MKKWIFITLCFIFLFASTTVWRLLPQEKETVINKPLNADELWSLVQEWRTDNGFQPYTKNQSLCRIAGDRTKDSLDYHKGLFNKYGNYQSVLSENGTQAFSDTEALSLWLNSPNHKKALEQPYKYACIAVAPQYAVHIMSNCENGCP